MFPTKNNNKLKSRSAGSTTRGSGGIVSQPVMLKMGSGVKTQAIIVSTPKATRPTKTPNAPGRSKPFIVSRALVLAKASTIGPSPRTFKAAAACKALNRDDVLQTPTRLRPHAAPKRLLATGAANALKCPPGFKAPVLVPARSAAVEAVRRQISEQQQKVSAVAARKASSGSPHVATLKAAPARDIKSDASATESIPLVGSHARRPVPAVRKGGVRKPVVVSKMPSASSSPGSPTPEGTFSSRRQRNSTPPPVHTLERANSTRRKIIYSPVELKTSKPVPAPATVLSRSAPVIGCGRVPAAALTKSQRALSVTISVTKLISTKDADEDPQWENAQVKDEQTPICSEPVPNTKPSTTRIRVPRPIAPPTELMKQRIAARRLKLSITGFTVHALVGQGSFGKVALVSLKGAHKTYAIKAVPKAKVSGSEARGQMLVEQDVARMVSGRPFLAGIEASFHDMDNFYLLMEYCPMSLSDHWHDNAQLPTIRVQLWTAEIASGLNALHKLGVLHRDLKLENILIGPGGHVRIADFGLAKRFPRSQLSVPIRGGLLYLSPQVEGAVGTAAYMAPEMWRAEPYSFAVDWWALGVVVYALTFGRLPWDHKLVKELERLVLETDVPIDTSRNADPELVALIRKALQKKVYERIKFEDIQAMSFFSSINWDRVASSPLRLPAPPTPAYRPTSTPSMFVTIGRAFPPGGDSAPEFTWASDAFAQDKTAADAVLEDEEIVREAIVSLDGEAPVFDAPAAWKAAFGMAEEAVGGMVQALGPVSCENVAVVSEVKKGGVAGVKTWWRRVVRKTGCGRA